MLLLLRINRAKKRRRKRRAIREWTSFCLNRCSSHTLPSHFSRQRKLRPAVNVLPSRQSSGAHLSNEAVIIKLHLSGVVPHLQQPTIIKQDQSFLRSTRIVFPKFKSNKLTHLSMRLLQLVRLWHQAVGIWTKLKIKRKLSYRFKGRKQSPRLRLKQLSIKTLAVLLNLRQQQQQQQINWLHQSQSRPWITIMLIDLLSRIELPLTARDPNRPTCLQKS